MGKREFLIPVVIMTILMFAVVVYADDSVETRLKQILESKVNKMTYDEALIELGQPSTITQGDEIFITTWFYETIPEARPLTREDILGTEELVGFTAEEVQQVIATRAALRAEAMARERENAKLHGKSLQMTFNKKTRVMTNWKYKEW